MGAERTLDEFTVYDFGTGKTLGCTEDEHRPSGLDKRVSGSCGCLDCLDFRESPFHRSGDIVIEVRDVRDDADLVSVSGEEGGYFLVIHNTKDGPFGDFETVDVKNGKYSA
jgi:hypothetical protein